jgi:hypothetical protein
MLVLYFGSCRIHAAACFLGASAVLLHGARACAVLCYGGRPMHDSPVHELQPCATLLPAAHGCACADVQAQTSCTVAGLPALSDACDTRLFESLAFLLQGIYSVPTCWLAGCIRHLVVSCAFSPMFAGLHVPRACA